VKQKKGEAKARGDYATATARGALPPSLHPKIDLDVCVGTGACAAVCPEKDVIAVIDGKARVVNPTNCIGHGECKAACPVDAIRLVIGSEKRGVDIPVIAGDFQTTVPGLYIVGELGGMGLIYNAVTQGVQCVRGFAKEVPAASDGVHQVLVVGAGPAGLASALAAMDAGLDVVTVDQENAGGTILQYPRRKIVMTRPFELPGYGPVMLHEVSKESLLELWEDVMAKTGLKVRTKVKVDSMVQDDAGVFVVQTSDGEIKAHRVVLAIGRRGTPRKLGVPGEDGSNVAYRLLEPENYADTKCLVVGGGDAAVEAAMSLGDAGATAVVLSYRKDAFGRIKPKNQERLEASVAEGKVELVMSSTAKEIRPDGVTLDVSGEVRELENDYVFVFAGGILPTKFLAASGVEVRSYKGDEFAPANA
jgi:thioredoxin reductase/NAD-dependent dihydropyrimidine dehydrogenase PreA subunit